MNINELTSLFTYLVCLSAATQKVTDIVKNWAPMSRMSGVPRRTFITVVSSTTAGLSALAIPPEGVTLLKSVSSPQLFAIAALLGSSGWTLE